jgi:hypothetical protein
MAYREPAVRVSQEFTNALPALAGFALPHVNVGPAFQVVKLKSAGSYSGQAGSLQFPGQLAGTYVDLRDDADDLVNFPVKVSMKNMVLRLLSQNGTGAVNPYDTTQVTDNTGDIFENVLPGDVLVVTGSTAGNNGSYTVREKISNSVVRTNEAFANVESGLTYSIRRNMQASLGTVDLPSDTQGVTVEQTQVTLPAGLTFEVDGLGTLPVLSADVLLSYRALRIDKSSDIWSYTSVADLQADFGVDQIVPENPVVFAAFIALQTATVETNLVALGADFVDDELLAYANAFDVVGLSDMYAINVLTHSTPVHTALKAHCETLSQPDNRLERVGIACRKLVTSAVVADDAVTASGEGLSGDDNTTLTSSQSHFLTDGVVPGHFVNIDAPEAAKGRYKIAAVTSQTVLVLANGPDEPANSVSFTVEKDLQKNEQAAVLAAYASSLAARRMNIVWPDVVRGPVGSEIRDLPGYFLGSQLGALTTGLPTQQGFTNLSVAFFTGVRHSTKYFDRSQLNTIAGGGVMIFAQDVLDVSALYIRHQLTSDTSAIKFQEYSITKNVDFIAKFIRNNHRAFIGKYNIVDTALDDLKANATGIINFLRDNTRLPKIGGVIRSGKLVLIEQDPVNIDSIIERYSLDIPIPLNNLDITIVV